jgi:lipopolysaccharide export system protein LptA
MAVTKTLLLVAVMASLACVILHARVHGSVSQSPVITADTIEFRKKENTTIFNGNVKAVYEKYILTADYVKQDDSAGMIEARGNVRTYYSPSSSETINSSSSFARYYSTDKSTLLWGTPYILYKSTSMQVKINADRISFNEKDDKINFDDNVLIAHEGHTAEGPHAIYYQKNEELYLFSDMISTGMPSITYSKQYHTKFSAGQITIFLKEKMFIFEKAVFGRIYN